MRVLLLIGVTLGAVPGPLKLPAQLSSSGAGPGRYAMALQGRTQGGCSQSSFSSFLSSSVVLDLQSDGQATSCRGRSWHSVVSSRDERSRPDVTEYVEQQGLRGRWTRRDGWIDVTLQNDDSVCAPVRRGPTPPAGPWKLECLVIRPQPAPSAGPREEASPPVPVLACFHEELGWPHDLGYALDYPFGVAQGDGWDSSRKGGWLMLSAGNGVRITESRFGGLHPLPDRKWELASRPIKADAWKADSAANPR